MSPERPPSQDSGGGGGGGGVGSLSLTQIIEPQNMVLSTIPTETSHIITTQQTGQQHRIITNQQQQQQHHHHQHHQQQQIIVNGNSYATVHSSSPSSTVTNVHHRLKTFPSTINSTPAKYVVFHQNGTSQYATVSTEPPTTTYITTTQPTQQSNGVGNIVVLATEPLDPSHLRRSGGGSANNGTDEDLTSLSWLHDKNLINNIVSYSTSNSKSATASPIRQSNNNNGAMSPTSDFLEDSCVSEDNASSANSSSDQGISIHNSDFSPTAIVSNNGFGVHHAHQQQTSQFQNGYQVHHHIQYANGNSNNNNNSTSKNRNHILSQSSSSFSTSSSQIVQEVVNTNGNVSPTGPTTTVHVGPSGTTTVVEYKAGSNFIPSPRHISQQQQQPQQLQQQQVPSPPQRISPQSNTIFVHTSHTANTTPTSNSSTSAPTTYHQQHFHKKYLREQMNGFEQNNSENNNRVTVTTTSATVDNRDQISTTTQPNNRQTLTTNQTTSSNGDVKEYHFNGTPIKSLPTTVSYTMANGQDDLIKEGINFESQNGGGSPSKMPTKQTAASPKQKHPTNLPYDPQVHTHNKPPYSFSSLIFMAIEDSPEKALPVKEIYAWIVQHFPYFKTAPTGWKNSVRHNLSLNKSFLKVEKAPNMGKGSLWRVEQNQRPNLIQALTRSPFFPCAAVDKLAPSLKSPSSTPNRNGSSGTNGTVPTSAESPSSNETPIKSLDAKLFPKLSKMIKEMVNKGSYNSAGSGSESTNEQDESHEQHQQKQQQQQQQQQTAMCIETGNNGVIQRRDTVVKGYNYADTSTNCNGAMVPSYETIERLARDCGADNIDDVNAAAAMLALKHGPKVFSETFPNGSPVITSSPSEDHTYSAGNGTTNSVNNSNNTSENNSNYNSSDGAYDSREGSPIRQNKVTPEELEEQRRHAEGVDALLSFASKVSSLSSSAASSPVKRSSLTSIGEDEHISSYAENIPSLGATIATATSEDDISSMMTTTQMTAAAALAATTATTTIQNQRQPLLNHSEGYYNHLLSPSPAKKLKTSRNLRTKIKRKATWIR